MARERVRMDDFEDGTFPLVCVSSGAPADRLYRCDLQHTPSLPFLFLLLGPIGILIVIVLRIALARRAIGYLPFSEGVQHRIHRSRRAGWIAAGVGVVVVALGVVGLMGHAIRPVFTAVLVAGLLVVVGGLIRACYPAGSVGGKPEANGRGIILAPVSPAFVAAYEAQEQRRRSARRADVTERA